MRLRSTLTTLAVTGALVGGGAAIANAASGTTGSSGSTGSSGTHTTTPAPNPNPNPNPNSKSTPTPPAKGSAPRGGHHCTHMGAGNGPRSGSSSSGSSFTPGYAPAPNV
jgi:hypothetical protein